MSELEEIIKLLRSIDRRLSYIQGRGLGVESKGSPYPGAFNQDLQDQIDYLQSVGKPITSLLSGSPRERRARLERLKKEKE